MTPGTVTIHVLTAGNSGATACLSAEELRRAAEFKFQDDAARWMAFRSGLRQILASSLGIAPREVPLVLGEFGKPALAPPYEHLHFNLSHSGDFALVAMGSDGPIGIDLEALDRAPSLLGCEETFCHPDEIIALPDEESARAHRLLELWTAKEALLKALGTGFSHPPEQVKLIGEDGTFVASPETPLKGAENIRILRIHPPDLHAFLAAVAVPSSVVTVGFLHAPKSTLDFRRPSDIPERVQAQKADPNPPSS